MDDRFLHNFLYKNGLIAVIFAKITNLGIPERLLTLYRRRGIGLEEKQRANLQTKRIEFLNKQLPRQKIEKLPHQY